jgi:hypothetical protein
VPSGTHYAGQVALGSSLSWRVLSVPACSGETTPVLGSTLLFSALLVLFSIVQDNTV